MAGTNDFLPVAIGGAPNVEDQADYTASLNRLQGWPTGAVPTSAEWNKMLRQSSSIAALIAQLVCNFTGGDMLDNGDQAAKLVLLTSMFRIRLLADTTFYVATTGHDDTGDGTVGNPWRTAQHALNIVQQQYDLNGHVATIYRAAGAYTDGVAVTGTITGATGPGSLVFDGAGLAQVTVTVAGNCYFGSYGAIFTVQNQKLVTAGAASGACISASQGAQLQYKAVDFGASLSYHISSSNGATVTCVGDHQISGDVGTHAGISTNSYWGLPNYTVTLIGGRTIPNFVVCSQVGSVVTNGTVFVGSNTGTRYNIQLNGVINTSGSGANYFPGNSAGVTSTGGQYS